MGQDLAEKSLKVREFQCQREMVTIEASTANLIACLKQYFPEQSSLMVWAMQAVSAGHWDGSRLIFANEEIKINDILEIRVFTLDSELHLKRADERFTGRYVKDLDGDDTQVVDSFSRLWGEQRDEGELDGYLHLIDDSRKIRLTVPYDGPREQNRYFGLVTRNYIGYEKETGLAGYVDMRFISINPAKGE